MELNTYAPDFELPSIADGIGHLTKYLENHQAVVVIFMCNHCPYVKGYKDRLIAIQHDYQNQGVLLVGINANDDVKYPEDSFEKMKSYAQDWQLNFPYLRDRTQDVAQAFGATCTPEPFLLNQEGKLCYRGQIDDNFRDSASVKSHNLREAIDCVLANKPYPREMEPAIGCSIKWR